jgi:phospholipase/carboxylesterase
MADLNGPGVPPADGGPARQLVVFLHGVGADGHDLIGLAAHFAWVLPKAEFLSPHAPFPCDMAPFGRQWFSLKSLAPQPILDGIRKAAPILDGFLDRALAERGLTDGALALVGFSQGAMMALHVGLRRERPCAALVGYSGLLAGAERLAGEVTARPPVLLVHGEEDDVIPFGCLAPAKNALEMVGVAVVSLSRPGLGHAIDEDGLMAGIRFLRDGFGREV